jgi:hypothetical protein
MLAHLGQKLGTTNHEVQDVVIEIQKFTDTAGATLVAMTVGTETVLLEVPALTVAVEATGLEIVRTFKTAFAAFAIVLTERTLFGEILSVLAPIIHVKTCFAMCVALRLATTAFSMGLNLADAPLMPMHPALCRKKGQKA